MTRGVLLWEEDKQTRQQAASHGLPAQLVEAADCRGVSLPFERTLIVGPGVEAPWLLLKDGFRFLDRWEAAAPLSERDLAEDLGRAEDRRRTVELVRDLRVPVYACELLFVKRCEAGEALLQAWEKERAGEATNTRLAFLRALYRVKPLFLALPRSWLRQAPVVAPPPVRAAKGRPSALVQVEIAPGRYVCCKPEEVEMYKARYAKLRVGRR